MMPTKREILIEDMELLQRRLDWLQQNVPGNDIWQNILLWEHTKIHHDIIDYILSKGEKNEKVQESDPQSKSGEAEMQAFQVREGGVDKVLAAIYRRQDRCDQQSTWNP